MARLDRLSNLASMFQISASRAQKGRGNLRISAENGVLQGLVLYFRGDAPAPAPDTLVEVEVTFALQRAPALDALPRKIEIDLHHNAGIQAIASLVVSEASQPRCGGDFALDRLCELLIIHLLRHHIETERAEPGLFAGLAHPSLSRALVAIHDRPCQNWTLEALVETAGMSRSSFIAEFRSVIGTTPIAYLKQWRMALARSAVLEGDRVNEIARRFGYGNSEAFCRAFTQTFGAAPTRYRKEMSNAAQ